MKKKYIIGGTILGLALGAVALANPSYFFSKYTTSSTIATTTVSYLANNNGTKTLIFDSWTPTQDSARPSDFTAVNNLALGVQFHASSTATKLIWRYEYASGKENVDCVASPTACDWYADSVTTISGVATTTINNIAKEFVWTFASSTAGSSQGIAGSQEGRAYQIFKDIPALARYIRVIFRCEETACAVWAELLPIKERN